MDIQNPKRRKDPELRAAIEKVQSQFLNINTKHNAYFCVLRELCELSSSTFSVAFEFDKTNDFICLKGITSCKQTSNTAGNLAWSEHELTDNIDVTTNTKITQANQDIVNILDSADIAFIFLDDAMLIRRFSSNAASTINLMPSDIGRPIHHISHSLLYDTFLNDIARSIQKTETIETEITTTASQQMLIKISPYYNEQNVAMGCVISLTDITEIRNLKQKLLGSWEELRSTLDTSFLQKSQTLKVLVVDDDDVDRVAISRAIKNIRSPSSEYLMTEVNDFEAAKEKLASDKFDICIIDHNLGSHTGTELVKNLKSKSNSPAFILLSGVITEDMAKEAINLGIFDVIDKQDLTPALLEQSMKYTQRHKQTEAFLSQQS